MGSHHRANRSDNIFLRPDKLIALQSGGYRGGVRRLAELACRCLQAVATTGRCEYCGYHRNAQGMSVAVRTTMWQRDATRREYMQPSTS